MIFTIHPINLLRSLSMALELSSGTGLSRHHWRTAMISLRIAEYINVDDWQRQILVYAALLHDLGAAARWEERRRLHHIQASFNLYAHAERGYMLLKDSEQLGMLAEPIRHHHDHWDGSSPSGLRGEAIPLLARIINIADRLEVMIRDDHSIFEQRADILDKLRQMSERAFDPALVEAVMSFAQQDSFWLDLTNHTYYQNFFMHMDNAGWMRFTIDDVLNIAEIFATIIDATSEFTSYHSRSVAAMSSFLAAGKGFSEGEVKLIRISGLLHDLGKLSIPNEVLEKPAKLSEKEFALIRQHPYYTYRILEQIDGFQQIAEWAAYHHETLDGSGYPFGIPSSRLSLGSRIVAVADVFVALIEQRPYRPTLSLAKAEQIMNTMVEARKLDAGIVSQLFAQGEAAYRLVQKTQAEYFHKQKDITNYLWA